MCSRVIQKKLMCSHAQKTSILLDCPGIDCPEKFHDLDLFIEHVKEAHLGWKPFKCRLCVPPMNEVRASSGRQIQEHYKRKHNYRGIDMLYVVDQNDQRNAELVDKYLDISLSHTIRKLTLAKETKALSPDCKEGKYKKKEEKQFVLEMSSIHSEGNECMNRQSTSSAKCTVPYCLAVMEKKMKDALMKK